MTKRSDVFRKACLFTADYDSAIEYIKRYNPHCKGEACAVEAVNTVIRDLLKDSEVMYASTGGVTALRVTDLPIETTRVELLVCPRLFMGEG
jgi:hypothetical protein